MKKWLSKLKLCLIFNLAMASLGQARDAYLAIEEPGRGQLFAGHALVIITEKGTSPLLGTAYSYGVNVEKIKNLGASNILNFSVTSVPANRYYRAVIVEENRSISLIKMHLNDSEVQSLEELIKAEISNPNLLENLEYRLIDNNCITHVLKLINQIVRPELKIVLMDESIPHLFSLFIKMMNLNTYQRLVVPSHFPIALKEFPLFDKNIVFLPRFEIQQMINFKKKLLPVINKLSDCGQWQILTQDLFKTSLAFALKSREASILESHKKFIKNSLSCEGAIALRAEFWWKTYDLVPPSDLELRKMLSSWAKGE